MVNFMCPLAWAMVPRHLVKHYSGCFCEYVFWTKITFWGKQAALHNVGGPHSVSRRPSWDKDWPTQERKNSPYSSSDWTAASVSPWVRSLTAHLNVLDLPLKLPEPILYYISMCVCVCVCVHNFFSIQTCTSYFFFSLENPDQYMHELKCQKQAWVF